MIELLAPAGNPESLRAAVLNGANAVYLGGTEFSARKYAGNFNREQINAAVRFCHTYGVRVFVTMNTLMDDNELERALEYCRYLYCIGVDALIIQDLGLLRLLKENIPDFELHASTQMTVHNLDGVNLLYNMGCKRVVLSRELTLKEIKYIADNTKAELEAFIHGALCIGFSGQCLFSSMQGGRSGNRGSCAQPCRKEYTLDGKNKAYNLSTKDLCSKDIIKDIIASGVTSLKIEGRMKRPEYVAQVVDVYRRTIDGLFKPDDDRRLLQSFNRGGFTRGYFMGRQGLSMMSRERPKNWGTYLGRVVSASARFASIKLEESLAVGDGIEIFGKNKGAPIGGIKVNGKNVKAAMPGQTAEVFVEGAKKGDAIYKSLDYQMNKEAEESYTGKKTKRVPVYMKFSAHYGSPITLTAYSQSGINVMCRENGIEKAIKTPTSHENVKSALSKLGDTCFFMSDLEIDMDNDIRIPAALLNGMRRDCIEQLMDKLQGQRKIPALNKVSSPVHRKPGKTPKIAVLTGNIECAKGAIDGGADVIFFGGPELRTNKGSFMDARALDNGNTTVLPWYGRIIMEEYEKLKLLATDLKFRGIHEAMCGNLGFYKFLKDSGVQVYLEKSFNLFNWRACEALENKSCMLSSELTINQMKNLASHTDQSLMVCVYGRLEAMVNRNCITGSTLGDGGKMCHTLCENKIHYLKDSEGEKFPVITDWTCRSHIYDSKILCTIDNIRDIMDICPEYIVLYLLDESRETSALVTKACREELSRVLKYSSVQNDSLNELKRLLGSNITKGHFQHGVE